MSSLPTVIAAVSSAMPFIVAVVMYLYKLANEFLPSKQRAFIDQLVQSSVQAVEQINSDSKMSSDQKKALAVSMVQKALSEFHLSVPSSFIDTLIEESVYVMNQEVSKSSGSSVGFSPSTPKTSA